jgi:hypothetical protein
MHGYAWRGRDVDDSRPALSLERRELTDLGSAIEPGKVMIESSPPGCDARSGMQDRSGVASLVEIQPEATVSRTVRQAPQLKWTATTGVFQWRSCSDRSPCHRQGRA